MDVNDVIDRVKNMAVFEVVMDVPSDFMFNGRVPYDMKIRDNVATVFVPALTQAEAEQRAWEYFSS
jgi:hypothetical protein